MLFHPKTSRGLATQNANVVDNVVQ